MLFKIKKFFGKFIGRKYFMQEEPFEMGMQHYTAYDIGYFKNGKMYITQSYYK